LAGGEQSATQPLSLLQFANNPPIEVPLSLLLAMSPLPLLARSPPLPLLARSPLLPLLARSLAGSLLMSPAVVAAVKGAG
jgi:hypothetical protein